MKASSLGMHTGSRSPAFLSSSKRHRQLTVFCRAEVRALVSGCQVWPKAEGTALLQEWVRDVGVPAGLSVHNTRLSSGSIGVPESRLELEVTFPSTSDWEQFLGSVSSKEHKAWSQRIQSMVVDGSPSWHAYRAVPLELDEEAPWQEATPAAGFKKLVIQKPGALQLSKEQQKKQQQQPLKTPLEQQPSVSLEELQFDELLRQELGSLRQPGESQQQQQQPRPPQLPSGEAGGDLERALKQEGALDVSQAGDVVLDWKGDPMVIKPGDRMPKWL